jgi:hypothetical protein
MKKVYVLVAFLFLAAVAYGQSCDSIAASSSGGWKPDRSPRWNRRGDDADLRCRSVVWAV